MGGCLSIHHSRKYSKNDSTYSPNAFLRDSHCLASSSKKNVLSKTKVSPITAQLSIHIRNEAVNITPPTYHSNNDHANVLSKESSNDTNDTAVLEYHCDDDNVNMLIINHVHQDENDKETQSHRDTINALTTTKNTSSLPPPFESQIESKLLSTCKSLEHLQHLQLNQIKTVEVKKSHIPTQKDVDQGKVLLPDNERHVNTASIEDAIVLTSTTSCLEGTDNNTSNCINGGHVMEDKFVFDLQPSPVNDIDNNCVHGKSSPFVSPLDNTDVCGPHQSRFRRSRSRSFHRPIFLSSIAPNNFHSDSETLPTELSTKSITLAQKNHNSHSYISRIGAVEAAIHYLPSEEKLQIRKAIRKSISDSTIKSLKYNNQYSPNPLYYSENELAEENIPQCPFRVTPTHCTNETEYLEHIKRVFLYYANPKMWTSYDVAKINACSSESDEGINDKYFISAEGLLLLVKHSLLQFREDCELRLTKIYPNCDPSEIKIKADTLLNKLLAGKTKNERIMKNVMVFLAKLYNMELSNFKTSEQIHLPIHIHFSQFLDYSKRSFSKRAKNG